MKTRLLSRRGTGALALVAAISILAGALAAWLALPGRRALDPVTTHGEWVKIAKANGEVIRAYVAWPERKDKAPAVIVIHEIFGLTAWEPTVADRLAAAGFVAIVPDLLSSKHGETPPDETAARKLVGELEPERVTADLDATYAYVDTLPGVRSGSVGTIGFCWGGGQSFRYATNNPRLKAAVVCYGQSPDSAALGRIQAPVLGVYGEGDARINDRLPAVSEGMKTMGKRYEYDIYPGTGHGFLKHGRKGNDTDQVDKAWARILGFYKSALGS